LRQPEASFLFTVAEAATELDLPLCALMHLATAAESLHCTKKFIIQRNSAQLRSAGVMFQACTKPLRRLSAGQDNPEQSLSLYTQDSASLLRLYDFSR